MTRTLKNSILTAVIILLTQTTYSQLKKPGFTLGGNLIYSVPKGSFDAGYKNGVGAEGYVGVGLGQTYLIGTLGISTYGAEGNNSAGRLTYTPMKLGIRQYFLVKRLFIQADLGSARVKNKIINTNQFTRGIGVGVRLLGLEAGLYYDGFKNSNASGFSNSLNVKVGWSFSL